MTRAVMLVVMVEVDLLERMLDAYARATEEDTDEILALRDAIDAARAKR